MVDRIHASDNGAKAVAWIALIIGIIALILAWVAYDRTGANLEEQIRTQVEQGINATENAAQETSEAIDAGPDGVDEDDTDTTTPR